MASRKKQKETKKEAHIPKDNTYFPRTLFVWWLDGARGEDGHKISFTDSAFYGEHMFSGEGNIHTIIEKWLRLGSNWYGPGKI